MTTINFGNYVKGNCLNLKGSEALLSYEFRNEEGLNNFSLFIKNNPHITALNLAKCGNKITKLLLDPINNSKITDLNVSRNILNAEDAKEIANKLPKLTRLKISNNHIKCKGAEEIANKLPHLTSLNISDNWISDKGAEEIANKLPNLANLNISNNRVGYKGAEAITSKLLNLINLNISSNFIKDKGAMKLTELSKLTHLNISRNDIHDMVVTEIAKKLSKLTHLDISTNSIKGEDEDVMEIIKLPYLTHLNISNNPIRNNKFAKAIDNALDSNTTLTDINLKMMYINAAIKESINKKLEYIANPI